jgi:hypothetical protein
MKERSEFGTHKEERSDYELVARELRDPLAGLGIWPRRQMTIETMGLKIEVYVFALQLQLAPSAFGAKVGLSARIPSAIAAAILNNVIIGVPWFGWMREAALSVLGEAEKASSHVPISL